MKTANILGQFIRADFLERARRYSFFVTLAVVIYLGYLFVPAADADYVTVALGDFRGVYNSAWIGGMMAVLTVSLLSLPGFYLVKNAIDRDERTGVGQIIASTPISKPLYTIGKTLSNFAVLAVMAGVLALVSIAMQLVRGESFRIDLWQILSPFLFIVLPALACIAALAVLFESIRFLRGGFGNVVFFFVWIFVLSATISGTLRGYESSLTGSGDLFGVTTIVSAMSRGAQAAFPEYDGSASIGVQVSGGPTETFVWEGIQWTGEIIAGRIVWFGVALGIAIVSAVFFDRFDPSSSWLARFLPARKKPIFALGEQSPDPLEVPIESVTPIRLTPLSANAASNSAFSLILLITTLIAEILLMFKGQRWWWYAIAGILILVGAFVPVESARQVVLPLTWIFPLFIWSSMGCRETRDGTNQIIFSTAHSLARQLPAAWLAGVIVAMLTGIGVAFNLATHRDISGLAAWFAAALFIPSMALALGIWSGSSKLFEVVYLMLWYIGGINRLPALDYLGVTATPQPTVYLALTLVLLILSVLGRQRQLQHR